MTWSSICGTCGKRAYLTRKAARNARRQLPNRGGTSVYPCGGYWHIGHLPRSVRQGRANRHDIYDTKDPR